MNDEIAIELLLRSYVDDSNLEFNIRRCAGGDTHRSYHVKSNGLINGQPSVFVKVNDESQSSVLKSEFESLELFQNNKTSSYPKPLLFNCDTNNCYLVMSFHNLHSLNKHSSAELGKLLAKQHQITSQKFGLDQDNYIGLTLQTNTQSKIWIDFYREQRIGFQLELAIKNGLDSELVKRIVKIQNSLDKYFVGYEPVPSLLHGDLWSGNAGFDQVSAKSFLYDPAPYFGDRETDIAMTELFGRFPESFYQAYQQAYPLHQDYEKRKPLYNLYHALNHFNLFGRGYTNMISWLIQQL